MNSKDVDQEQKLNRLEELVQNSNQGNQTEPKYRNTMVILISGKRFSGKDTLADILKNALESIDIECEITSFADELKRMYCDHAKQDYKRMLTDREYKEQHREKMKDYYYELSKQKISFSEIVTDRIKEAVMAGFQKKKLYIVSDLRLKSQINSFRDLRCKFPNIELLLVRVNVTDQSRSKRGWTKNDKVDLDPTETELDAWSDWNFRFDNNEPGLEWVQNFVDTQLLPFLKK